MKYLTILLLFILIACNANPKRIIVCVGNSLTAGNGASKSYPEQLKKFFGSNTRIINQGVGGKTTQYMISQQHEVDKNYNSKYTCILVAWEIGNDIYFNGNAVEATKRFEKYCKENQLKGWKVIALTLPPRPHVSPYYNNDYAAYQRAIDSANVLLRLDQENYCDGLIDLAKDKRLSHISAKYWNMPTDSVHLNDSGYAVVAGLVQKEILKLSP